MQSQSTCLKSSSLDPKFVELYHWVTCLCLMALYIWLEGYCDPERSFSLKLGPRVLESKMSHWRGNSIKCIVRGGQSHKDQGTLKWNQWKDIFSYKLVYFKNLYDAIKGWWQFLTNFILIVSCEDTREALYILPLVFFVI